MDPTTSITMPSPAPSGDHTITLELDSMLDSAPNTPGMLPGQGASTPNPVFNPGTPNTPTAGAAATSKKKSGPSGLLQAVLAKKRSRVPVAHTGMMVMVALTICAAHVVSTCSAAVVTGDTKLRSTRSSAASPANRDRKAFFGRRADEVDVTVANDDVEDTPSFRDRGGCVEALTQFQMQQWHDGDCGVVNPAAPSCSGQCQWLVNQVHYNCRPTCEERRGQDGVKMLQEYAIFLSGLKVAVEVNLGCRSPPPIECPIHVDTDGDGIPDYDVGSMAATDRVGATAVVATLVAVLAVAML